VFLAKAVRRSLDAEQPNSSTAYARSLAWHCIAAFLNSLLTEPLVSLQFVMPHPAWSDESEWEARLHLKAPDVNAYNSLQVGETRARRGDIFDGCPLDRHRSCNGLKGNLRIFYADSSRIGVVLAMLRTARAARRRGIDIVLGHMPLHRAPDRQLKRANDLMAQFECLPLEIAIDGESDTDFDVAAALRSHPAIIATGKPVSAGVNENRGNAALDRWYLRIEQLLGAGVDVWTAVYHNIRPGRLRRTSPG
jgi:hypothetical protein